MKKNENNNIPRIVIYGSKGFEEIIKRFKTYTGKCFPVLFSGISADCKEVAADIIAAELGLSIYRADLLSLKDRSGTETEKNINRIFREASAGNSVLFLDEADSLFGQREKNEGPNDQFANDEVRHLLRKMGEYDGIVILATHHSQSIDEAFLRNMRFVVEFPETEEKCRKRS